MLYKGKIYLSIIIFSAFLILNMLSRGPELNKVYAANAVSFPTVIIDAGHGGFDPGAISGDVREKDINLCIATKLYTQLLTLGIKSTLTRDADYATGNTKSEDLQKRADIANKPDKSILVSIHQNMFHDGKYSGAQMFYGTGEGSGVLAEYLKTSVVCDIQPENRRECKSGERLYILSKSKCPSVMVECGFMSNKSELSRLTDNEYQNKFAFSLANGIYNYIIKEYQNV